MFISTATRVWLQTKQACQAQCNVKYGQQVYSLRIWYTSFKIRTAWLKTPPSLFRYKGNMLRRTLLFNILLEGSVLFFWGEGGGVAHSGTAFLYQGREVYEEDHLCAFPATPSLKAATLHMFLILLKKIWATQEWFCSESGGGEGLKSSLLSPYHYPC